MKMASLHDGTPRYAVHRIIFHRTSTSGDDGHSNMLGFEDEHAEAFAPRGMQQDVRESDDLRRRRLPHETRRLSHGHIDCVEVA